ncbi:hypothetical protein [Streptomyces sp. NPDC055400]
MGRVAVQIDHAGQLGDLGTITQGAVLVQGGMPEAVGHSSASAAGRLGDRVSDREEGTDSLFPHVADVGEEGFRRSGAVGAAEDIGAVPVSVGICLSAWSNTGGGVGSGVAGPQSSRHGLAGVREETQRRMEAEAALARRGGLFLFRVTEG